MSATGRTHPYKRRGEDYRLARQTRIWELRVRGYMTESAIVAALVGTGFECSPSTVHKALVAARGAERDAGAQNREQAEQESRAFHTMCKREAFEQIDRVKREKLARVALRVVEALAKGPLDAQIVTDLLLAEGLGDGDARYWKIAQDAQEALDELDHLRDGKAPTINLVAIYPQIPDEDLIKIPAHERSLRNVRAFFEERHPELAEEFVEYLRGAMAPALPPGPPS